VQLLSARFQHIIRFDRRSIIASASQNGRFWPLAGISKYASNVAFEAKADMADCTAKCPLMTQRGHTFVGNCATPKMFRLPHTCGRLCDDFVDSVDGLVNVIQIHSAG
jgi:hypothetical protein